MSKFQRAIDLGCLDLGCLDSQSREADYGETVSATSRSGKKKKPAQRKTSPLHWFPRRKVDSYLERKIRKLQEVDGMNLTLDETLGDSNPHYCRVLREKMAAREAAHRAMEARKAALVEASWCRILKAARIQSKDAEDLMVKAEEAAVEAFEAATSMGVIMYAKPDSSRKRCQIETSAGSESGSSTHTVTASFETAFEVDKEVAAALKAAFARLSNHPSFSKDESKDLLRKISENPDVGNDDGNLEISEVSSECESESESELETLCLTNNIAEHQFPESVVSASQMRQQKPKRRQSFEKLNKEKLIDMMSERLQGLQEDELSSLATIVATCGLNAALAEVGNHKLRSSSTESSASASDFSRRMSFAMGTAAGRNSNFQSFMNGQTRRKLAEPELPSLDKFLVKHMTKLEREVEEAKNSSRNISKDEDQGMSSDKFDDTEGNSGKGIQAEKALDLESILVKHSSKLEKEIEHAKKKTATNWGTYQKSSSKNLASSEPIPDLGSFLVKKQSRLEKEIEDSKRNYGNAQKNAKGNVRTKNSGASIQEIPSLDKFLVKHVSKLEKEVQEAKKRSIVDREVRNLDDGMGKENINLNKKVETEKTQELSSGTDYGNRKAQQNKRRGNETNADYESLDKVLIKHVSKLEKEKMKFKADEEAFKFKKHDTTKDSCVDSEGGLDKILVKHKSRLEREKTAAAAAANDGSGDELRFSAARRQAREREMKEAWGGISLGNSVQPRLSKLEREKAAWIKAEEEERRQARNEV